MLEVDTTILTPFDVLKSSGHVDRFSDWMTRDEVTGDIYRADHLFKAWIRRNIIEGKGHPQEIIDSAVIDLSKADGFSGAELQEKFNSYDIKSDLGNSLTPLSPFNLMFGTDIGPSGLIKGFLRPETAQGQFVNFKKLLESNSDRMPFASAQIGKSFRNEISPRSGLLRVREFLMAEIEHYVNPMLKNEHPKFDSVACHSLPLLSRKMQESGYSQTCMTRIDNAIEENLIDNKTLGYFLGRIYLFLLKLGFHSDVIRFRQHLSNEMAHYASDCWDAEILTSYGWIECIGCADRSAYDLTVHSKRTKEKLIVREKLPAPITELRVVYELDQKSIGITFKKNAKLISEAIVNAEQNQQLMRCLLKEAQESSKVSVCLMGWDCAGKPASLDFIDVPAAMISLREEMITTHILEYTPAVIEPSFGIGRIIYALLEHSYWTRAQDEQRSVLSLCPIMAPCKVIIIPLLSQKAFECVVRDIASLLKLKNISTQTDCSSTTVGKKYSRADELGTPFAVTVDHQTLTEIQSNLPGTVTLRDRDSTAQIRIMIEQLPSIIHGFIQGNLSWNDDLISQYVVETTSTL